MSVRVRERERERERESASERAIMSTLNRYNHRKGGDVDEITIDPSANWSPVDKPKDSKDDEADSPPQKKVKLDGSAPGTPSAGDTPRAGTCLLYTSPSPRDATLSRMPSSA